MPRTIAILTCAAWLGLAGCDRQDPQAAAQAQAAASEHAATEAARGFDAAVSAGEWELARAHGDIVLADFPGSAAARRIAPQHAQIVARAAAATRQRRLQALWSYQGVPVAGGQQRSAGIHAREEIDVDGSGAKPVQLIFRDHPDWGRSSYLVLRAGDFDCYGGCTVQVTADDGAPRAMAASRPDTDEAIAMFIEDERALWRLAGAAQAIAIEFPVKAGGTRTAVFETGGLEPSRLPDWN
jgi:hypothetical protein